MTKKERVALTLQLIKSNPAKGKEGYLTGKQMAEIVGVSAARISQIRHSYAAVVPVIPVDGQGQENAQEGV